MSEDIHKPATDNDNGTLNVNFGADRKTAKNKKNVISSFDDVIFFVRIYLLQRKLPQSKLLMVRAAQDYYSIGILTRL